eukprot:UN10476
MSGMSIHFLTMHFFSVFMLLISRNALAAGFHEEILLMSFGLTAGTLIAVPTDTPFWVWSYINPYWWITQCLISQLDKDYRDKPDFDIRGMMEFMGTDKYTSCKETVVYFACATSAP